MDTPSPQSPGPAFQDRPARLTLALGAWAAFWLAVQALLQARGLGPRPQTGLLLGAWVLLGGLAWGLARDWTFRLLTSVPFAAAQAGFLALAALGRWLGLSFLDGPLGGLAAQAHALLLTTSMLAVAWKRRPYDLARAGFLLVHGAPSLLLLGWLWGHFFSLRALVSVPPGRPLQALPRVEGGAPLPLPGFQLRAEPRTPALRLRALLDGKPALTLTPRAGLALPLGQGHRLEVEQVLPDAVESEKVEENPGAGPNPALRVVLGLGLPAPLVGHLFAHEGSGRQDEPGGRFAVVFQEAWNDSLLDRLRPRPPKSQKLVLDYQGLQAEHGAAPGDAWAFSGLSFQVVRVFPDFAVRPGRDGHPEAFSRSTQPREPWAQVHLAAGDGRVLRLLLSARHPEVSDRLNAPTLPPGARLRYVREDEEAQDRFVVFTRQEVRLVTQGRVVRREPLVLLRPFVVEPGLSVTPEAFLEHAQRSFAPSPGPGGSPAALVTLTDLAAGVRERHWVEWGGTASCWGGRVTLACGEGAGPLPLAILDGEGRPLAQKSLEDGESLAFRGYVFQAAPEGIRVTSRPGTFLLGTGMAALVAGCAWMFHLKPRLRKGRAGAKP